MADIYFKNFKLEKDPELGWVWHKVDGELEPVGGGEGCWGISPTLEEAMEEIESNLTPSEQKNWSTRPGPLCNKGQWWRDNWGGPNG